MQFLTITWDIGKGIPLTEGYTLRFYQLLFALGFVLGYQLMKRWFKQEGVSLEWLDKLVTYMVLATIIGARLGHVFFYQWDYYSQHPAEILMVWEGGLASHGAAVAIILAMYWFSKKVTKRSMWWILDRVVITVALAGCFIRLGNWFNSEIYGSPANSAIQTVYAEPALEYLNARYEGILEAASVQLLPASTPTDSIIYPHYALQLKFKEGVKEDQAMGYYAQEIGPALNRLKPDDQNLLYLPEGKTEWNAPQTTLQVEVLGVPRWPTQLLESLGYLLIFVLLFRMYQTPKKWQQGYLFGLFLVAIFGFRFFIEFLKVDQVAFEAGLQLNMGQNLSIPLVLFGMYMMLRSRNHINDYSTNTP